MSDAWSARAGSFDAHAAQYEDVRPSYPDDAIETILRFGGLEAGARALEVGCGTGKATRLFLGRGLEITAVEPGPQMIEVARAACPGAVRFYNGSFEDWPLEAGAFDLVFAAQSFHWVDQTTGYAKAGAALHEGGTLALFWNRSRAVESPLQHRLAELYERRGVNPDELSPEVLAVAENAIADSIRATGLFDEPERVAIPWSRTLATARYVSLLETHSAYSVMPAELRGDLLRAVAEAVDEFGGEIEVHEDAVVHLARRV